MTTKKAPGSVWKVAPIERSGGETRRVLRGSNDSLSFRPKSAQRTSVRIELRSVMMKTPPASGCKVAHLRAARLNRRHASADYGIGGEPGPYDEFCRAQNTDEERAAGQDCIGVEFCGVAVGAGSTRAGRETRRAGDRQQRLQERSKAAEGRQRRPHHGRDPEAARLLRDGGGEPDAAGFQRNIARLRQGRRARRHRLLLLCGPRL